MFPINLKLLFFYNLALISSNNVIFDKNCKEASKENIQQIDNRLNLIRDLKNLKESVYSTNSSIGLSKILTKIDILTEEKNLYIQIRDNLKSNKLTYNMDQAYNLFIDFITDKNKEFDVEKYNEINLRIFNVDDLEDKISDYTYQIEKLENERDKLNASTTISFEFSQDALKVLGL